MKFKRPSLAAVVLAFLVFGWAGSGVAEAGKCRKTRPLKGKVCVKKCSNSQGMIQLEFTRYKPGDALIVRIRDCVDIEVLMGEDGTAVLDLDGLAELRNGYILVVVPAHPNPKEYVPRMKCGS